MHHLYFVGRHSIIANDAVLGMLADRDHPVGHVHSRLFYLTHQWVATLAAGPVGFDGVHVEYHWTTALFLGTHSRPGRKPIMGVDDVEFPAVNHAGNRVLIQLLLVVDAQPLLAAVLADVSKAVVRNT